MRRDEGVVRAALQLVGVDYDALIRMDAASPFSLAVKANPGLMDEVMASPSPVIEALKVALSYKPQAEFAAKYGNDPQAIRDSIRAEVMAEMKGQNAPEMAAKTLGTPVFSSRFAGQRLAPPASRKSDLASIFGK